MSLRHDNSNFNFIFSLPYEAKKLIPGRRSAVAQHLILKSMVVISIPTRENFPFLLIRRQHAVLSLALSRNISKIGRWVGNELSLHLGPSAYPAICEIQREAKTKSLHFLHFMVKYMNLIHFLCD